MKRVDIKTRIHNLTFYSPDGCWIWLGYLNTRGYGLVKFNGLACLAHRVNYELFKGNIPDGMQACHHCDNRACINPDHIFIGTALDNAKDMVRKGRSPNNLGEKNPNAIVTGDQVIEIRALKGKKTYKEIGNMYGISRHYAWNLANRKSWKHI